jgi:DeoR family transcriptional regulator of aga operon
MLRFNRASPSVRKTVSPVRRRSGRRSTTSPEARRQFILDRLEEQGECSYAELAKSLRVSSMTVRRDLEPMVRERSVIRTVGGIQPSHAPPVLTETATYSRLSVHRAEKRAIARRALELLDGPSTIFIDGSTTCVELARCIARERKHLTIVTNSALICLELSKNADNVVIGIGGQYDTNSLCFVGAHAEELIKTFFFDLAFTGTVGVLPTEGTFESFMPTIRVKQAVARQSQRLVLLVDHSKFGRRALSKVLDIHQIHTVVTDGQTPRKDLAALAKTGIQVCVATRLNTPTEKTSNAA